MKIPNATLAAATLALLLTTGCRVNTEDHGDKKNVSIATPFGSMNVDAGDKPDLSAIGLAAYPGATPYKAELDGKNKDGGSANINLSFGDFHLGVKVASLLTPDSQDKVLSFYKKDLARYGDVITCRGDATVGEPTHTAQGLTCAESKDNHITANDMSSSGLELRAGSRQHQHIVGVEDHNGQTKIGLVALDLPTDMKKHGKDDVE